VINYTSSSGTDAEPSDVDEIMVQNLSHENGLVSTFTVGKLTKILQPYSEVKKLSEFDLKLFKSFFAKDVSVTDDPTLLNPIRENLLSPKLNPQALAITQD